MILQQQWEKIQGAFPPNGGIPENPEVAVNDQVTLAKNQLEYTQGGQFPKEMAVGGSTPGQSVKSLFFGLLFFLIVLLLALFAFKSFRREG